MASNQPPNDDDAKAKFQSWVNEVLDKREADAAAAAAEQAKKDAEEAEKRRTNEPMGVLRSLLGF